MDTIKKCFAKFLVLALVISFVFPAFCNISEASSKLEYIFIEIYQDEDKIVTVEVPKKLSNDQKFLDNIKEEYLNSLNNYETFSLSNLDSSVSPFYVTPEQPKNQLENFFQ